MSEPITMTVRAYDDGRPMVCGDAVTHMEEVTFWLGVRRSEADDVIAGHVIGVDSDTSDRYVKARYVTVLLDGRLDAVAAMCRQYRHTVNSEDPQVNAFLEKYSRSACTCVGDVPRAWGWVMADFARERLWWGMFTEQWRRIGVLGDGRSA